MILNETLSQLMGVVDLSYLQTEEKRWLLSKHGPLRYKAIWELLLFKRGACVHKALDAERCSFHRKFSIVSWSSCAESRDCLICDMPGKRGHTGFADFCIFTPRTWNVWGGVRWGEVGVVVTGFLHRTVNVGQSSYTGMETIGSSSKGFWLSEYLITMDHHVVNFMFLKQFACAFYCVNIKYPFLHAEVKMWKCDY